jgi:hypothetical protein
MSLLTENLMWYRASPVRDSSESADWIWVIDHSFGIFQRLVADCSFDEGLLVAGAAVVVIAERLGPGHT